MRSYFKIKTTKRAWLALNDEEVADLYKAIIDLADKVNESTLDGKVRIENGLRITADRLYQMPSISVKSIGYLQNIYQQVTTDTFYVPGFEAVLLETEKRRLWMERAEKTRKKNDALRKAGLPVPKASRLRETMDHGGLGW